MKTRVLVSVDEGTGWWSYALSTVNCSLLGWSAMSRWNSTPHDEARQKVSLLTQAAQIAGSLPLNVPL
jgi:hypothetical protein